MNKTLLLLLLLALILGYEKGLAQGPYNATQNLYGAEAVKRDFELTVKSFQTSVQKMSDSHLPMRTRRHWLRTGLELFDSLDGFIDVSSLSRSGVPRRMRPNRYFGTLLSNQYDRVCFCYDANDIVVHKTREGYVAQATIHQRFYGMLGDEIVYNDYTIKIADIIATDNSLEKTETSFKIQFRTVKVLETVAEKLNRYDKFPSCCFN